MIRYGDDHVWARCVEREALIGVSHHLQTLLGNILFVDLPSPSLMLRQGALIATIESVKTAIEVHSPVSGFVTGINTELYKAPKLINDDAEGAGWLIRIRLEHRRDINALMDAQSYRALVQREIGSMPA